MSRDFPAYAGTREEWVNRVIEFVAPRLAELGIAMPPERAVRVGVTPLSSKKLGVCYVAKKSVTGTINFIGLCTKQADPRELVHTLVHEYLHACDDVQSGHRHRWKRWADLLGMKARGHDRNAFFDQLIDDALTAVGVAAQHVASREVGRTANPSQVRLCCRLCLRHVHMPRRLQDEGFVVICADHGEPMQPDLKIEVSV